MPFTVEDFEDLLRLLYEKPEWQERLRRAILPPELFELPRIAKELAEINRAERERVSRLEAEQQATRQELREGFTQTGERLDRVETDLTAFRTETTERFNAVDERFARIDERFNAVDGRLDGIDQRLDVLMDVLAPSSRSLSPFEPTLPIDSIVASTSQT
jgi:chromosome segregation ATPase